MRHRQAGRKLGRTMAHREMMMRNLVTSLVLYEKIITTAAKAKDLRERRGEDGHPGQARGPARPAAGRRRS